MRNQVRRLSAVFDDWDELTQIQTSPLPLCDTSTRTGVLCDITITGTRCPPGRRPVKSAFGAAGVGGEGTERD